MRNGHRTQCRALAALVAGAIAILPACGGDGGDGGAAGTATTGQPTATAPTTQAAPDTTQTAPDTAVVAGEDVYRQQCSTCHGAQGGGGHSGAPALAGNPQATNAGFVEAMVRSGPGIMPSFEDMLSEQEIADVAAYVAEELAPEDD